ncbi:MAG: hypothetical protein Q4A64_05830 [Porphyromonadaceae bacterium]|nr:hypothetical protein [Porphyromonadaceae bacterium]
MKQTLWIISICLFLCSSSAWAQEGKRPSREEVAKAKRAYLVEQLALDDKQASGLMAILNELDDLRFKLWQEMRDAKHRIYRRDTTLTEDELRLHFERSLDNRVREAELERVYYKKCATILPIEKLVRLEWLNRRFARNYFKHHIAGRAHGKVLEGHRDVQKQKEKRGRASNRELERRHQNQH